MLIFLTTLQKYYKTHFLSFLNSRKKSCHNFCKLRYVRNQPNKHLSIFVPPFHPYPPLLFFTKINKPQKPWMKQGHFIKLFFFLDVVAKRKQKILIQPDKPNVYKRRIYFLNKNKMDFHFSILLPWKKKEGNKKIWVRVKSHFLDVLLLDI